MMMKKEIFFLGLAFMKALRILSNLIGPAIEEDVLSPSLSALFFHHFHRLLFLDVRAVAHLSPHNDTTVVH